MTTTSGGSGECVIHAAGSIPFSNERDDVGDGGYRKSDRQPTVDLSSPRVQNTFATPNATPTATVVLRLNSAVVGATTWRARPFLSGIDAPKMTTAPASDWYWPSER